MAANATSAATVSSGTQAGRRRRVLTSEPTAGIEAEPRARPPAARGRRGRRCAGAGRRVGVVGGCRRLRRARAAVVQFGLEGLIGRRQPPRLGFGQSAHAAEPEAGVAARGDSIRNSTSAASKRSSARSKSRRACTWRVRSRTVAGSAPAISSVSTQTPAAKNSRDGDWPRRARSCSRSAALSASAVESSESAANRRVRRRNSPSSSRKTSEPHARPSRTAASKSADGSSWGMPISQSPPCRSASCNRATRESDASSSSAGRSAAEAASDRAHRMSTPGPGAWPGPASVPNPVRSAATPASWFPLPALELCANRAKASFFAMSITTAFPPCPGGRPNGLTGPGARSA